MISIKIAITNSALITQQALSYGFDVAVLPYDCTYKSKDEKKVARCLIFGGNLLPDVIGNLRLHNKETDLVVHQIKILEPYECYASKLRATEIAAHLTPSLVQVYTINSLAAALRALQTASQ